MTRCGAVSGVVVDPPDEPDARALRAAPPGVDETLNKPGPGADAEELMTSDRS